jgi:hypothetical protein
LEARMTAILVGLGQHYQGVSGDTKPTAGVAAGSIFDALDTGQRYVYDGSAWQLPPGGGAVGGGGGSAFVTLSAVITKTGAGDVTAYTAKDVFDAATGAGATLTGAARAVGGSGVIVKARLATDLKTCVARWRLHLFNAAPTYINDNLPFLYLYANESKYVGSIDFDAVFTEDPTNSTAAYSQKVGNLLPFVCGATANLFGILEVLDGFTPTSAQTVTVTLTMSQA